MGPKMAFRRVLSLSLVLAIWLCCASGCGQTRRMPPEVSAAPEKVDELDRVIQSLKW
jgi:hypothetical protein